MRFFVKIMQCVQTVFQSVGRYIYRWRETAIPSQVADILQQLPMALYVA